MEPIYINLNGTETTISGIKGYYAVIVNHGNNDVYLSRYPNINTISDNVFTIPAHSSKTIPLSIHKTLYAIGEGKIEIIGTDNDSVPYEYVDTNKDICIQHADSLLINNNLLINSDFRHPINQRGAKTLIGNGYFIDRWRGHGSTNELELTENGVRFSRTASNGMTFGQAISIDELDLRGETVTFSVKFSEVTGYVGIRITTDNNVIAEKRISRNGIVHCTAVIPDYQVLRVGTTSGDSVNHNSAVAEWAKLELGSLATPFMPVDCSNEITKCQRFYQICSTNSMLLTDMRPTMRSSPRITQLENGYFAYDCEI